MVLFGKRQTNRRIRPLRENFSFLYSPHEQRQIQGLYHLDRRFDRYNVSGREQRHGLVARAI